MELQIVDQSGAEAGSAAAPAFLAEGEIHMAALHQTVTAYLANQRSGTSKVKTRSEVRGSGRKMFRQKGLGRARMGDRQSPIRVGGGIIFGPSPRSYRQKTPRKMKQLALISALRDKLQNGGIKLVESFPENGEVPKTKRVVSFLKSVGANKDKTLLVTAERNAWLLVSSRNVPYVETALSSQIHPYQILTRDLLLFSVEAWEALLSRLGLENAPAAEPSVEEEAVEETAAEEAPDEEAAEEAVEETAAEEASEEEAVEETAAEEAPDEEAAEEAVEETAAEEAPDEEAAEEAVEETPAETEEASEEERKDKESEAS